MSGRSPGGGHGSPFQYSCLEDVMDRGTWWATVHGFAKSWTWLSDLTFNFNFYVGHSFYSKEQASFNFMAPVTICSDFGAQDNKICHCFHCFPIYLPWSDGTGCHDLSFLIEASFFHFSYKRDSRELPCPFCHIRLHQKDGVYEPESEFSPDTRSAGP